MAFLDAVAQRTPLHGGAVGAGRHRAGGTDQMRAVPAFRPAEPRPLLLGALRLPSRYWLSPLAGYTNLPFRRAVRELGGLGLATTDLVNARALLKASPRTMELIATA